MSTASGGRAYPGVRQRFYTGPATGVEWLRLTDVPLALGSAVGAYFAARLVTKSWAKVWVYRFLVLVVILSIAYLLVVDSTKFLQHT